MKLYPIITSILIAGAFTLPAIAQDSSPSDTTAAATPKPHHLRASGSVTAIDTSASTITISSTNGDQTYSVSDSTKITKADGTTGALTDIKVGDHIHGSYKTGDDGKMTLSSLRVGGGKHKHGGAEASPT
ncbi:MAG: hypothetical protein ABSE62_07410 [Chthoniobacteraceae bacterium]|jgi:hypothetical protein